jgi:hypothetical protein
MPETDVLLLCLLIAVAVAVVLLVVLLLRKPDVAFERLRGRIEQALREEQRAGRGELLVKHRATCASEKLFQSEEAHPHLTLSIAIHGYW